MEKESDVAAALIKVIPPKGAQAFTVSSLNCITHACIE